MKYLLLFFVTIFLVQTLHAEEPPATTEFGGDQTFINDLIGQDIKDRQISVTNAELTKTGGLSTIELKENGNLFIFQVDEKGQATDHFFYQNIKEGGKFELNEKGEIQKADLTASEDTSFRFGGQSVSVPKDTRVVYENGKIAVFGKSGTEFDLKDESGSRRINILDEDGVMINNQAIQGGSFQLSDVKVTGMNEGPGTLTLKENGNLLGKGSIADWKNLEIRATENEVLLVNPGADLSRLSHANYVYPGPRLEANGAGFSVSLKPGNDYIPMNPGERFEVSLLSNSRFSLAPETNLAEPSLTVGGIPGSEESRLEIDNGALYTYETFINSEGLPDSKFSYLTSSAQPGYGFERTIRIMEAPKQENIFTFLSENEFTKVVSDIVGEYGLPLGGRWGFKATPDLEAKGGSAGVVLKL